MMKWLLAVAVVLAACERVVDLTPDATFAKQPDAAVPDAPHELDDGGNIGDADASIPPDAATLTPDVGIDSI